MRQQKNDKKSEPSDVAISGLRMPRSLVDLLRKESSEMERTIVAQIRVCVREWFQLKGKVPPANIPATISTNVAPSPIRQAVAPKVPPSVQAIVEDETGWEHGESTQVKR